jgi:LuxR family transcriptional regulator, maltose regulon positive regulatory protein
MRSDFERAILYPVAEVAGSNDRDAVAPSRWQNGYTDGRSSSSHGVNETLTPRERDILAMISQGLSNKHIARALKISPETVKSHVKNIFLKLEVGTRAAAVSRAGALGLL